MTEPPGAEEVPDTDLGRHMDDSRNDLDLTWDDVASQSGLSRQTLYDIRKGNTDYARMRSSTKRKIEKALRWARGSIDAAVLHGQRPAPKSPTEVLPVANPAADPDYVPAGWSEEEEQRWRVARETLAALKLHPDLTRQRWRYMRDEYTQLEALDRVRRDAVTDGDLP